MKTYLEMREKMLDSKPCFIKARVTRELKEKVECAARMAGLDESTFIRKSLQERIVLIDEIHSFRALMIDYLDLMADDIKSSLRKDLDRLSFPVDNKN